MKSLREIVESSPQMSALTMRTLREEDSPTALGPARWDWQKVRRVLVIRLRSIGDTVLATPSLIALKRFLPHVQVDILLEDWVSPVLDGFTSVDDVITLTRGSAVSRARVAKQIRSREYDVVYNLHGGTTATLLTRLSGAKHRVGYSTYQYARLHNHQSPPSSSLWGREKTHSVEQQLALLGWTGVPVTDRPPTQLKVTDEAAASILNKLRSQGLNDTPFAVIHPTAAFDTKQWATDKFAQVAEDLSQRALGIVVITAPAEAHVAETLKQVSRTRVTTLTNLSLPEVTALISRARLFVGNDSGIAHIAAAVGARSVVVFGSSNIAHWRPWAKVAAEVVLEEMECQPCHGYYCEKFEEPECIKRVPVDRVVAAIHRVLRETKS